MIASENARGDSVTLGDYLRVVRRRKWTIIGVAALLAVAAVLYSLHSHRQYGAAAEVLLGEQLTSLSQAKTAPDRVAATQAALAHTPTLAARVIRAADLVGQVTPEHLLAASTITPGADSDVLVFHVRSTTPLRARRLATQYAREFVAFRRGLDRQELGFARRGVDAQIARLVARGDTSSPLYHMLNAKANHLRTEEALQTGNALLVSPAERASQVAPKPTRNLALAVALGLILGVLVAFVREALHPRVRSAAEIRRRLGLPLLGQLPELSPRVRAKRQLEMLADPHGRRAERFRTLRTNFALNVDENARTIVVTSAVAGEGKSTTAANLAIALARTGRRVILVDLNLRRPSLARFFGLERRPGLLDVIHGRVEVRDALARVVLDADGRDAAPTNGRAGGSLHVLPSQSVVHDADEVLGDTALDELLAKLRTRADLVLVDAPPLLGSGDAFVVAANADALVIVARLNRLSPSLVGELRDALDACPTEKIGLIVVAGDARDQATVVPASRATRIRHVEQDPVA